MIHLELTPLSDEGHAIEEATRVTLMGRAGVFRYCFFQDGEKIIRE
jgi:hypothetical protein